MRCEFVEVEVKFSAPTLFPDGNGILYTEEAILDAIKNTTNLPITQYSDKGAEEIIGHTNNIRYENGHICCKGFIYAGGFNCITSEVIDKTVTKMKFVSVGFDHKASYENGKIIDKMANVPLINAMPTEEIEKALNMLQ